MYIQSLQYEFTVKDDFFSKIRKKGNGRKILNAKQS